jgi:hypothetical protein
LYTRQTFYVIEPCVSYRFTRLNQLTAYHQAALLPPSGLNSCTDNAGNFIADALTIISRQSCFATLILG